MSCYQTLQSVLDPLVAVNADGKPTPYLAESIEPNADYTVWTIKARSGITFHDGTPFDGAAIADNIIRQTKSFLTAKAVSDIATNPDGSPQIVVTDPMTVTITMKRSWVIFPIYLAGQLGYIGSPTWLKAADADPTLEPKPVGTGPFIFKDYKPGESFTATKNPDYWNKPYPYIDEYETRVIPDALTRAAALEAGDVDIIHTTNGDSIKKFRDDGRPVPDAGGDRLRRDGLHAPARDAGGLAAHRRTRALRDGLRNRRAGDHRQGRGRRSEDRERPLLSGPGRKPRGQRLSR